MSAFDIIKIQVFSWQFSILLSMILILLASQVMSDALAQISSYRSEIKIIAETSSANILQRQVQLTSLSNVTGARVAWSDLFDDVQQRSINASKIVATPEVFDVKPLEGPVLLNVIIDASDAMPGVYTGRLLITQGTEAPLSIPITLTLHNSFWLAFGLVAAGVIIAVIVQVVKYYIQLGTTPEGENVQGKHKPEGFARLKQAGSNSGGWAYAVLFVLVIVAVLTAWQTYFPNITSFGRAGLLDYAAAFLSGFGSQSVVNAAVDIIRKKS